MVDSTQASSHAYFVDFGLADAALLEAVSDERPLLTADGRLYAAALSVHRESAMNFDHYRANDLVD